VRRIPGPYRRTWWSRRWPGCAVGKTRALFERENTDGAVWTPTGEDYDEFLWHFVLVEAVFGGESAQAPTTSTLTASSGLPQPGRRSTCAHGAGQGQITADGPGTACSSGPS
jgi:hypothetical protein